MARLIPQVRPEDVPADSERLVLTALLALPNEFVVMHSFPWLRPLRDLANEPLNEGEADFVILSPSHGLLVVEVKGGIPELRERTWYRGEQVMRDPFEQARRNRYALLDALEERTGRRITRNMFPYGDLVVFPHCRYVGALPMNTDPRVLVDGGGLPHLAQHVESAFAAWQRRPCELTPTQFEDMLGALLPKLRLMRCVGAELASEGARIVQISAEQRETLKGLLSNRRVLVEGAAGSGKTLLALEFAVTLASGGKTILFLCYNRHLAAYLQELVRREPRLRGREGSLEIATYHAYALALARRGHVEFEVPRDGATSFWDDEVPLIVEQALETLRSRGGAPLFDAVVVDEAQDFSREWWVTVESLSREGRGGGLYVFLDLHQSLRGESEAPPVSGLIRFPLVTNCRNTRAIARGAGRIVSAPVVLLAGMPEGEVPRVRQVGGASAGAGAVAEEVRQLFRSGVAPNQIALIGPMSLESSPLCRSGGLDGVPYVGDPAAWRGGRGILVTTARAFKGLEADVVIIYGVDRFTDVFTMRDLYVAWTRAKHRLVVVCTETGVRETVVAAVAEVGDRVGGVTG